METGVNRSERWWDASWIRSRVLDIRAATPPRLDEAATRATFPLLEFFDKRTSLADALRFDATALVDFCRDVAAPSRFFVSTTCVTVFFATFPAFRVPARVDKGIAKAVATTTIANRCKSVNKRTFPRAMDFTPIKGLRPEQVYGSRKNLAISKVCKVLLTESQNNGQFEPLFQLSP